MESALLYLVLPLVISVAYATLFTVKEANAQDQSLPTKVKITRYTSLDATVPTHQKSLLDVIIRFQFDDNVRTVGQAIKAVLQGSGYRLARPENSDPNVAVLLRSPLPRVHRSLGPATVRDLLVSLAGPAWTLITDPVHRLISYDLAEQYWPCDYKGVEGPQCQ